MIRGRLLFVATALVALTALNFTSSAEAQTRRAPKPKPPVPVETVVAAAPVEKCLRALNGACTNPVNVEIARQRAFIIPSVLVSYFGTPAGTIGGAYIPFERFFQDNPVLFGLPTSTLVAPGCCVVRTR